MANKHPHNVQVPVASGRGESGRESVGDGVPTARLLLLLLRELCGEENKQKRWKRKSLMQCNYQPNHPEAHAGYQPFISAVNITWKKSHSSHKLELLMAQKENTGIVCARTYIHTQQWKEQTQIHKYWWIMCLCNTSEVSVRTQWCLVCLQGLPCEDMGNIWRNNCLWMLDAIRQPWLVIIQLFREIRSHVTPVT